MEKKEDFFHELDTKGKRSFCTCQTLAIGLTLLAIAIAVGATILVRKVTTAVTPNRTVSINRSDATELREKIADLSKAPGASTTLVVTEGELSALLIEAVKDAPAFPLRGVQATIDPSAITLSGQAPKLGNSNLDLTLMPRIVDGKPKLELVKIQAGTFTVPTALTETVATAVEGLLAKQLTQLNDVTVKSIILGEGKMTISGTINPS